MLQGMTPEEVDHLKKADPSDAGEYGKNCREVLRLRITCNCEYSEQLRIF